jgi:hypothetical protein
VQLRSGYDYYYHAGRSYVFLITHYIQNYKRHQQSRSSKDLFTDTKLYTQIYIYSAFISSKLEHIFFCICHISHILTHVTMSGGCKNVGGRAREPSYFTLHTKHSDTENAYICEATIITPDCGFELLSCCDEGRSGMMTMISLNIYCKLRQQITHPNNIPGHTRI